MVNGKLILKKDKFTIILKIMWIVIPADLMGLKRIFDFIIILQSRKHAKFHSEMMM